MPTSANTDQVVTVVAVVLLVATLALTWSIADVRRTQAAESQRSELINRTVTDQQAPGDYDGDGVPDGQDRCPTRPETDNGFQDDDGCPDVVASTGAS